MSSQSLQPVSPAGRPPKGIKKHSISWPEEHFDAYKREADELGIYYSTYVVWQMAIATGQPVPDWVDTEVRAAQRKREQEELPLPKSA